MTKSLVGRVFVFNCAALVPASGRAQGAAATYPNMAPIEQYA